MFQNNCYDTNCTVIVVLQEKLKSQPEQHSTYEKTQPSYRTLTRAEKFVTQATERLILDGKEARIATQIMTKTKVKYISDSLLILQVVLHKWQKLFCILLLSLCQKVSCGILKEKRKEKKERKKEAADII